MTLMMTMTTSTTMRPTGGNDGRTTAPKTCDQPARIVSGRRSAKRLIAPPGSELRDTCDLATWNGE